MAIEKLFPEGSFVTNPRMPDWGTGKVLELRDGGNIRVFFEGVGEKIMPPMNMSPASSRGDHPLLKDVSSIAKPVKAKTSRLKSKTLG
jgi:hypothetical protein